MRMRGGILCLALLLAGVAVPQTPPVEEEAHPASTSQEFKSVFDKSIDALLAKGFGERLEGGGLNAVSNDEYKLRLAAIKKEVPINPVLKGDAGTTYDVILQPGHYGRTSGRVGTSGKLVSERALVAYLTGKIADDLRGRGLKVLVVSADSYLQNSAASPSWNGLSGKVFLAVHADGNEKRCSTGPSLGYEAKSSLLAMHAIGWGLAQALGYPYESFMKDNLTVNEAKYYMFRNVHASSMKGLLEVGELTCESSEIRLIQSSNELSHNVAEALAFVVKTSA